jgi:macrolide-specific efflux system membrane fusion protein
MTVWAEVAEADVVLLKPGTPLYFTTLGMPEREWYSIVRQVLPTPEVVNDVVLYNALIDIDNTDRALMSEMTAQVFLVLDRAENLPLVPLAALSPGADGKGHGVTLLKPDGTRERRPVQVRLSNRTMAAVASGLEGGEQVVLPGAGGAARAGGRLGGFGARL